MSRYDGTDLYTYPGSDVLRNKADIRDPAALDAFEADATAIRLLELYEHPIQGKFDLAHYMGEINATHPFRDGNGRAQRAYCAQLAAQAGYFIDFDEVGSEEMIAAMIASFRGDNKLLIGLLDRVIAKIGPE